MATINAADDLRRGSGPAEFMYVADRQIWPAPAAPPAPESLTGNVLAFNSADISAGSLSSWPDRSPANNDLIPYASTATVTSDYATFKTSESMVTSGNVGVTGNSPRHIFMKVRTRSIGGSFMGYGVSGSGQLFDLWNYNPGALIWHGHGGGYDTLSSAPTLSADAWHTIEVSYNSSAMTLIIDTGTPSVVGLPTLYTPASLWTFGSGGYNAGGDFDMKHFYFYDHVLSTDDRNVVLAAMV